LFFLCSCSSLCRLVILRPHSAGPADKSREIMIGDTLHEIDGVNVFQKPLCMISSFVIVFVCSIFHLLNSVHVSDPHATRAQVDNSLQLCCLPSFLVPLVSFPCVDWLEMNPWHFLTGYWPQAEGTTVRLGLQRGTNTKFDTCIFHLMNFCYSRRAANLHFNYLISCLTLLSGSFLWSWSDLGLWLVLSVFPDLRVADAVSLGAKFCHVCIRFMAAVLVDF
jgi:hypothetical protein